jgi:hypothetical protein
MDHKTVFVRMALHAWQSQADRCTKFIQELPEDKLLLEIAPGKNRGMYVVGHLAAVHDALPEILGLGKRVYPDLYPVFLQSADRTHEKIPSVTGLKTIWTAVHDRLKKEFEQLPAESWFTRHESMTDTDFEKDPTRNKLSVLLNRTGHFAYHFGQLVLLK